MAWEDFTANAECPTRCVTGLHPMSATSQTILPFVKDWPPLGRPPGRAPQPSSPLCWINIVDALPISRKQSISKRPSDRSAKAPQMTSDPRLSLLGLINGFQITQAIRVAATLRVADHLNDGARSAGELAALTKSHPDSLYRLLRALAAVGVFREDEGRKFTLTPMGDCLRTDSATPLGAWAEVVGSPYYWQAWGHLLHSVQTGENAFQNLNGKDVWQFRAEHPEYGATFDRAMTQLSAGNAEAVIRAYDFSPFRHVVDVGGGQGFLLAAILRAQHHIR